MTTSTRERPRSRRTTLSAALCLCAWLLALNGSRITARAEDAPLPPDSRAAAQGTDEMRALQLLDEALSAEEESDWWASKNKLEQAHRLAEFPNILFHLARASFRVGDQEQGLAALARYEALAGPNNPNREQAALLRATHPRPGPPEDPNQTHGTSSAKLPVGPLITVSAGGAVLIAALVAGLVTSASKGELERNCTDDAVCPSYLEPIRDRGEDWRLTTNILLGVGLAAVAGGTAWWLFGREERVETDLGCSGDGCRASTRIEF